MREGVGAGLGGEDPLNIASLRYSRFLFSSWGRATLSV
jgi:hypothetical protein